jgi:hypothetical protein
LFAEIRREKNNKELLGFQMFGGWHFCPLFVLWKGEERKDNRELTNNFLKIGGCHFAHQ